jgi:integrase
MIAILEHLNEPTTQMEWMMALLHGATALRGEEAFGLHWGDVQWKKNQILIQRGWSKGKQTDGKNEIHGAHFHASGSCRIPEAMAGAISV